jgi:hypothetical protein
MQTWFLAKLWRSSTETRHHSSGEWARRLTLIDFDVSTSRLGAFAGE